MNTRILKEKPVASLRLALFASAGFSLVLTSAPAQVVIEGGPGPIQLSDRDGRPEPAVPGKVPGDVIKPLEKVPQAATGIEANTPEAVEIEPDPTSSVSVRVPVERPNTLNPDKLAAPDAAEPGSISSAVPALDVAAAKRKAELIRELGISDSGTGAKMAFTTENLYEKDSALITSVAIPQLKLLAEFIRLTNHKGVAVTYRFEPALRIEKLAWERSVSLVEWMKTMGGLPDSVFTVNDPAKVPVPDQAPVVGADKNLPVERIEVVVDYR